MPDKPAEPTAEATDEAAGAAAGPAGEPAWRARLRGSKFGQTAVVLVASFAVAIAAWMVVKPNDTEEEQAETAVVTQVDVQGAQKAPVAGDRAPAFTATDIDSHPVSLEALRGRPVWLMFVATWCTGCRTEMPDVQTVAAARAADAQVVIVYVGESPSTVRSYSDRVGNDLTEVADQSQQVSAAYGVMGVPSHFFIDGEGVVRQVHVGLLSPDQMNQSLDALTGA